MPATYPTMERLLRGVEPEARSRELTQAEKAQAFLEEQLAKITSRERARRLSMTAFGGAESGIPGGMGAVDFVPFLGSAKGLEEGVRDVNQATYDLEAGRYGSAARNYGAAALGMLPGAAGTLRAAPAVGRAAVDMARSPTAERALGRLAEATGAAPMYAAPKDYRGSHTAPGPDYGAPLHDVSSGGMYPSDFYGPNGRQYYGNEGWDFDANAFNKVLHYKNKPDAKVTIFRAVPKSVYKEAMKSESPIKQLIQPGDWITLSKEYAKAHGESALNNDYKIVQKMVPARQVWTNADSIHEWGYHPDMPNETGSIKAAPQDEALRLAQLRAALPPAQGGLGLPANNTPEQRAKAMEFDLDKNYVHNTSLPFDKVKEGGRFSGIFSLPNYSANYGNVDMPLVARGKIASSSDLRGSIKNPSKQKKRAIDEDIPSNIKDPADIADAYIEMQRRRNELARELGYTGVKINDEFGDTISLVSPENIRSRFAAFDPWRRDAATAALFGVAAPDLLAKEKTEEPPKKKKKPEGALSTVTQ